MRGFFIAGLFHDPHEFCVFCFDLKKVFAHEIFFMKHTCDRMPRPAWPAGSLRFA